ncbi:MAG: hypothetical protein V4538_13205 [Bacteroidota bacterium]
MDDINDRKKMAWEGWFYAIQRIDLLIISISGAGIYVVLETLKYSIEKTLSNVWQIKGAGILFVAAIVINFLSQFTGKEANGHEMKMCAVKLSANKKKISKNKKLISKHDTLATIYTNWTNFFNMFSFILMVGALIMVMYFFITF